MVPLDELAFARLVSNIKEVIFYVGNSTQTSVEESGDSFVALKEGKEFRRANLYNSVESRILVVNIFVAPEQPLDDFDFRTLGTEAAPVLQPSAHAKALEIFARIDPLLNGVTQSDWPEVVSCYRDSSDMLDIPDGDGAVLLSTRYRVNTWL